MGKIKSIIFFCILLTLPAYFLLKQKDINIEKLKNSTNQNNNIETKSPILNEIYITEGDFKTILSPSLSSFSDFDVAIDQEGVNINGTIKLLSSLRYTAKIAPEIIDKKPVFKIISIEFGVIKAPVFIKNKLEGALKEGLSKNISNDEISAIKLEENRVILVK